MTKTYTVQVAVPAYRCATVTVEAESAELACERAITEAEACPSAWGEGENNGEAIFVQEISEHLERALWNVSVPATFAERTYGDLPDAHIACLTQLRQRIAMVFPDLVSDPDSVQAEWVGMIDNALAGQASPPMREITLEAFVRSIAAREDEADAMGSIEAVNDIRARARALTENYDGGHEAECKAVGEAILDHDEKRAALVTVQSACLKNLRYLMSSAYSDMVDDPNSHVYEWLKQIDRAVAANADDAVARIAGLEAFARTIAGLTKDGETVRGVDEPFAQSIDDAYDTLGRLIEDARAFYPELAPQEPVATDRVEA